MISGSCPKGQIFFHQMTLWGIHIYMWDPYSATGPTLRAWHVPLFGYIVSPMGGIRVNFVVLTSNLVSSIAPHPFAISKRLMMEIDTHIKAHFSFFIMWSIISCFLGFTGNLWWFFVKIRVNFDFKAKKVQLVPIGRARGPYYMNFTSKRKLFCLIKSRAKLRGLPLKSGWSGRVKKSKKYQFRNKFPIKRLKRPLNGFLKTTE